MPISDFQTFTPRQISEKISSGALPETPALYNLVIPRGETLTGAVSPLRKVAEEHGLLLKIGRDTDYDFNTEPKSWAEKAVLIFFCTIGMLSGDSMPVAKLERVT